MDDRLRRLLIAAVAAACLVTIGIAFSMNKGNDPEIRFAGGVVESVEPRPGDSVLRQSRIVADMQFGYEAALFVDRVEIPDDDLDRIDAQAVVAFTPREGKLIEKLVGGRHCASVLFWRIGEPRSSGRTYEWCFTVT